MKIPKNIFENSKTFKSLKKKNIYDQYIKAKKYVLAGYIKQTKFSLKEPKNEGVRYFRINKQFRALGRFDKDWDLLIYKIDNHQNQ